MIEALIKTHQTVPPSVGLGVGDTLAAWDEFLRSLDPATAGLPGDHAQGVTALLRRLEEAFCEVVNE